MPVRRPSNVRAVRLRRDQTDAERRLWFSLRDRRLVAAKFRRQVPIGPFVVDFLCADARLIVEVDGGQHAEEDPARQRWLEQSGYRVLRFWNNEISHNLEGVLQSIAEHVKK